METLLFGGAALLLVVALFGAWHGIQALRLASRLSGDSQKILRLAAWNLLEPLISTVISLPVGMWGIAWSFNCGMNGTRGCNQVLMGLIFLVPFISPFVLLLLPVWLHRARLLEPWHGMKISIVRFGVLRFVSIILVSFGFFFGYINYFFGAVGFAYLIFSLLEVSKIVRSIKTQFT